MRTAEPRRLDEHPIAPGFGRLRVSVYDLSGKPLPEVEVTIFGPGLGGIEEDELQTDAQGSTYADVRPGHYRVVFGSQAQRLDVPEDESVHAVFRYYDEGEIEIRSPLAGNAWLREAGGPDSETAPAAFRVEEGKMVLRYVRPGSHDLYLQGNLEQMPRPLGRVSVQPRRRTVFVPQLPAGGIDVRVEGTNPLPSERTPYATATLLGAPRPPQRVLRNVVFTSINGGWDFPGRAEFRWLPAGRWRIEYQLKGFRPARAEVSVGAEIVPLTLRLESKD